MSRPLASLIALLIALLLPLQLAWGAAAAYCQHEDGPAAGLHGRPDAGSRTTGATHFGHHDHVHTADGTGTGVATLALDDDCGLCHMGCAALPGVGGGTLRWPQLRPLRCAVDAAALNSAPGRAPDRPQWPGLA